MYSNEQTVLRKAAALLLVLLALCLTPLRAQAEIKLLFENCDGVLAQPDYAPLRKYLDGNAALNAQMCQRLDGNKVYLITAADGEDNSSNFYYCDLGAAKGGCAVDDKSKRYPNLSLIQQFEGAGGQQYVLWKASVWSGGRALTGYHLFAPAPRTKHPRGYVLAPLSGGTSCHEGEAGVCHCDPALGEDSESVIVEDPVVVDEGLATVRLQFKRTRLQCTVTTDSIRLQGGTP